MTAARSPVCKAVVDGADTETATIGGAWWDGDGQVWRVPPSGLSRFVREHADMRSLCLTHVTHGRHVELDRMLPTLLAKAPSLSSITVKSCVVPCSQMFALFMGAAPVEGSPLASGAGPLASPKGSLASTPKDKHTMRGTHLRAVANLTTVALHDLEDDCVDDKVVSALLRQHGASLSKLSISGCSGVGDAGLSRVGTCPRLESLSLHGATATKATLQAVNELSRLRSLTVSGCRTLVEIPFLSVALTHLDLRGCPFLDPLLLCNAMCGVLATLETLVLAETPVGGPGLANLVALARAVNKSRDTPVGVKELDVSYCEDADPDMVAEFACQLPLLQVFRARTVNFTDEHIKSIVRNCPVLRTLDIERCKLITGPGLSAALTAADYPARRLETLCAAWCPLMDDGAAANLIRLPSLRSISLSGCKMLTSAILVGVQHASQFGRLKRVDLSWVNGIDPSEASAFAADCPGLELVDYFGDSHASPADE